jgi:pimeloyl-[acyl-carrier protein] synthase
VSTVQHTGHEPQDHLAQRFYARIRDMPPVFRMQSGILAVAGHPEAVRLLSSRSVVSDDRESLPRQDSAWDELARRFFIFTDGAEHARLRRLVSFAFTNRRLQALAGTVERLVRQELARLPGRHAEMMSALAFPVASRMIADLLGLPHAAAGRLARWAHELSGGLTGQPAAARFDQAAIEIQQFLHNQIPYAAAGGLLRTLSEQHADDRLTADEIVTTAALLLVAGFETSANFFGNLLLGLLWRRERYEEIIRSPDLADFAVEEMLRLFTPAHIVFRKVVEPFTVGDAKLVPGTRVAILLGACNRDPRVFDDPDTYRPQRHPNPHLTFSHGAHYCLGAGLARLEASAMLRTLVDVAPGLTLADDDAARWETRLLGRGLARLGVVLP